MSVRTKDRASAFVDAGEALERRDDEALLAALLRARSNADFSRASR